MRQWAGLILIASGLLGGCRAVPTQEPVRAGGAQIYLETGENAEPTVESDRLIIRDAAGEVEIQKVPFQVGVSSATVERMARKAGCEMRAGAGLMTDPGPVEVYRVQCVDGRQFLAQCELRQCREMRRQK